MTPELNARIAESTALMGVSAVQKQMFGMSASLRELHMVYM